MQSFCNIAICTSITSGCLAGLAVGINPVAPALYFASVYITAIALSKFTTIKNAQKAEVFMTLATPIVAITIFSCTLPQSLGLLAVVLTARFVMTRVLLLIKNSCCPKAHAALNGVGPNASNSPQDLVSVEGYEDMEDDADEVIALAMSLQGSPILEPLFN